MQRIDVMKSEAKAWGLYIRSMPKAWPSKNSVWRMYREMGASGSTTGPASPEWEMPEHIVPFHVAWRGAPERFKMAIWAVFVAKGSPERRAQMYDFKDKNEMYRAKENGLHYLWGVTEPMNAKRFANSGHRIAG